MGGSPENPKCLVAISCIGITPFKYFKPSIETTAKAVRYARANGANIDLCVWCIGKMEKRKLTLLRKHLPVAKIHISKAPALSYALNEQLLFANGRANGSKYDILFRMDGDDECFEQRFTKQLEFIRQNPGHSVYSAGAIYRYSDGSEVGFLPSSKYPKLIEHYANNVAIHPVTAFVLPTLKKACGRIDVYGHSYVSEDKLLWQDKRISICRQRDYLLKYTMFGNFRKTMRYRLLALKIDLRFSLKQKIWLVPPLLVLSSALFVIAVTVRDVKILQRLRSFLFGGGLKTS